MTTEEISLIVKKAQGLPDGMLAQAWCLMHGNDWKYWKDADKARDMRSILQGGTMPCVSFERWMNVIDFITFTVQQMDNPSDEPQVLVSTDEDNSKIHRCAMLYKMHESTRNTFANDTMQFGVVIRKTSVKKLREQIGDYNIPIQ